MRYSAFSVFLNALRGNKGWKPAWRNPVPKNHYDVSHHRRRRTWPCNGLLSRQGVRRYQCGRAGKRLYRLRQCRPQHDDHPLQLPAAGQQSVLRTVDEALGRAGAGFQLQRHGVATRRCSISIIPTPSATPIPGAATQCGCTASMPICSTAMRCARCCRSSISTMPVSLSRAR